MPTWEPGVDKVLKTETAICRVLSINDQTGSENSSNQKHSSVAMWLGELMGFLELEVQAAVSYIWVLGMAAGLSARAEDDLVHWVIPQSCESLFWNPKSV